ncbi:MAG: glycosyl hydrolase [Armatimonadetes bacterium]|nr:glycosyl hydrolase [Armatimonadota bacterium]
MRFVLIGVVLVILVASLSIAASSKSIRIEAESGEQIGTQVSTNISGFSGTGYVTGFDKADDKVVMKVQAKAGLYEVRIRYSASNGEKGFELAVNGAKSSGMFAKTGAEFAAVYVGKVELQQGLNKIAIEKGWGWYDVDYVELTPAIASKKPQKLPETLADHKATPRTHALMSYLAGQYGSKTLSGQFDQSECEYIREVTGKTPAILGGDFMDYTPSRIARGANPNGLVEKLIKSAKAGQIITMCWHWNSPSGLLDTPANPWYSGFYTKATKFDIKTVLDNLNSDDYKMLISDIDAIAVQLKKFADADIPVLWRPLHEAEGGWFWWGAKGPESYIKLWKIMFDRLTNHHGLHNLIWVHNCVKQEWYPGDAYVDVVGVDAYPADTSDPLSGNWDDLIKRFDGKKLLAITEFGGVPDVAKMHRFGARWAFFVSWTGNMGPKKMDKEMLSKIYKAPLVVNQGDVKY